LKILGIDEAGRGPVIGSLVMCGYLIDEKNLEKLKSLGVRDSKLLTPSQREKLVPELKKLGKSFLVSVSAKDIDSLRSSLNLNKIEIDMMNSLIKKAKPDKVIIDAPEKNTMAFAKKLDIEKSIELVCKNYADKNHVEVAAASVIAKVERDSSIMKLHKKHSYFGSGYPSDPDTMSFLKNWIKKNKDFPDFVRKTWITASELKRQKEQKSLKSWK